MRKEDLINTLESILLDESEDSLNIEAFFERIMYSIHSNGINFTVKCYELPIDFIKNVDIYIYPGYKYKVLSGLITNFHLPKSTLIMLVSAFIGREKTMQLYELAIKKKYRFYSFGDATLLLKSSPEDESVR